MLEGMKNGRKLTWNYWMHGEAERQLKQRNWFQLRWVNSLICDFSLVEVWEREKPKYSYSYKSPIVYNSSLYSNSTYCSASPISLLWREESKRSNYLLIIRKCRSLLCQKWEKAHSSFIFYIPMSLLCDNVGATKRESALNSWDWELKKVIFNLNHWKNKVKKKVKK